MKIHHIKPDCDPLMIKWPKLSKHEFVSVEDCDIIYCASVTQLDRAYALNSGKPIVCYTWDLPTNYRSWCKTEEDYWANSWRDGDIVHKLDMLYHCDHVISASNATKTVLDMYGIKSDVLYHFYDHEALDRVEVKEKKNRIIQISRYALNKRFDLTLEMWSKIQDKYPDWELMFVGFGDAGHLKDHGLERVTILEDVPESKRIELMKESTILVSPSLNEGLGLSPLEAKHCGLMTICSDIPTTEEFDYASLTFKKDDVEDYAKNVGLAMRGEKGWCVYKPKGLSITDWTTRFDYYMEEL